MMVTNRRFAMVNLALDSEWADLALWTNGVANTAFYGRRISLVSIRSHGKSASRVNAAVIAGHNCTVVCGRNWHQGALANATDLMRCCHGVRCENSTWRWQKLALLFHSHGWPAFSPDIASVIRRSDAEPWPFVTMIRYQG